MRLPTFIDPKRWTLLAVLLCFRRILIRISPTAKLTVEYPIPKMPFDQLCDLLGDAIKSVPSEKVIKTFKQTLFSLPLDGSRDEAEGSKKLLKRIAGAPRIDQIPEKYRLKVSE